MIIFGIDPGTDSMGYAVLEYDKNVIKIIEHGTIHTKEWKKEGTFDFLENAQNFVWDLINLLDINFLAIERTFAIHNPLVSPLLVVMTDVMKETAQNIEGDVGVKSFSVKEWRKYTTGNGAITKAECIEYIQNMFPSEKFESKDEIEALGIAYAAIKYKEANSTKTKRSIRKKSTPKQP